MKKICKENRSEFLISIELHVVGILDLYRMLIFSVISKKLFSGTATAHYVPFGRRSLILPFFCSVYSVGLGEGGGDDRQLLEL